MMQVMPCSVEKAARCGCFDIAGKGRGGAAKDATLIGQMEETETESESEERKRKRRKTSNKLHLVYLQHRRALRSG